MLDIVRSNRSRQPICCLHLNFLNRRRAYADVNHPGSWVEPRSLLSHCHQNCLTQVSTFGRHYVSARCASSQEHCIRVHGREIARAVMETLSRSSEVASPGVTSIHPGVGPIPFGRFAYFGPNWYMQKGRDAIISQFATIAGQFSKIGISLGSPKACAQGSRYLGFHHPYPPHRWDGPRRYRTWSPANPRSPRLAQVIPASLANIDPAVVAVINDLRPWGMGQTMGDRHARN